MSDSEYLAELTGSYGEDAIDKMIAQCSSKTKPIPQEKKEQVQRFTFGDKRQDMMNFLSGGHI